MKTLPAVLLAVTAVWSSTAHQRPSTQRAGLAAPNASARLSVIGASAVVCATWRLLGLSFWMLLGLCSTATTVAVAWHRRQRTRRREAMDADVVTLCLGLAGEIRSGRMPADAVAATITQLGPLAHGMGDVARAAAHGAPLEDELQSLAESTSSQRLCAVAAVWAAATTTGARVADVLERLALAFAAEDEAATDLEATAAGPRATATVLSLLPVVGVVLATAIGAHPFHVLLHTGLGAALITGAVSLDALGIWWVRRITRGALHR